MKETTIAYMLGTALFLFKTNVDIFGGSYLYAYL